MAEKLALRVAQRVYPEPRLRCSWRDTFLDSEFEIVCSQAIIADIDVWNEAEQEVCVFLEIKAHKVTGNHDAPVFFLSKAEYRSYHAAKNLRIPYLIWLFQYKDVDDFEKAPHLVSLIEFDNLQDSWITPEQFLVRPERGSGVRRRIRIT